MADNSPSQAPKQAIRLQLKRSRMASPITLTIPQRVAALNIFYSQHFYFRINSLRNIGSTVEEVYR